MVFNHDHSRQLTLLGAVCLLAAFGLPGCANQRSKVKVEVMTVPSDSPLHLVAAPPIEVDGIVLVRKDGKVVVIGEGGKPGEYLSDEELALVESLMSLDCDPGCLTRTDGSCVGTTECKSIGCSAWYVDPDNSVPKEFRHPYGDLKSLVKEPTSKLFAFRCCCE